MAALFNLFLDLCLLRKGPQDVPASMLLLKLCLLAYGLIGLIVLLLSTPIPVALLQALLDIVLLSGLLYVGLTLYHHPERFEQTLTALAGSRSTKGSGLAGTARWTASRTASYWCGPVTARTFGCAPVIYSGSAPRQPVTSTLPFSRNASPIASRRRWLTLATVALAQLMVVLDATVVNIALPAAQAGLTGAGRHPHIGRGLPA